MLVLIKMARSQSLAADWSADRAHGSSGGTWKPSRLNAALLK